MGTFVNVKIGRIDEQAGVVHVFGDGRDDMLLSLSCVKGVQRTSVDGWSRCRMVDGGYFIVNKSYEWFVATLHAE